MLGAITGDVVGSIYEWNNIKTKDFPLLTDECFFTDDTVLTVALADAILSGSDFVTPYNSWGNGAAMRISPAAYAYGRLEEVLLQAERYTAVTHNHPEGIKGAQAIAAAIFIGRTGGSRMDIRNFVESSFGYDLSQNLDAIRPNYRFDESCQGTVPQALVSFLESETFEDAIRNAISIGGDSDTVACITGSVAEAFYGEVPPPIASAVLGKLDSRLRTATEEFRTKHVRRTGGAQAGAEKWSW